MSAAPGARLTAAARFAAESSRAATACAFVSCATALCSRSNASAIAEPDPLGVGGGG